MAKRFTDTNKYKKPFIRTLPGAYKLFWDYLYHDCDHAGIWIVDFEIAQLYLGNDMSINNETALKYFNNGKERIIKIGSGTKWFIPSFIEFQYGELSPQNRAHTSVINILKKYNLLDEVPRKMIRTNKSQKSHLSSLLGAKDKDMVKAKDKDMYLINNIDFLPDFQDTFLTWLRYKRKRRESYKDKDSTFLAYKKLLELSDSNEKKAIKIIEQSMANNWAGLFELKENSRKIPKIKYDGEIRFTLADDGVYRNNQGEPF